MANRPRRPGVLVSMKNSPSWSHARTTAAPDNASLFAEGFLSAPLIAHYPVLDPEDLLLLGLELLVAEDALIAQLGEPLQLAHVLGLGRGWGRGCRRLDRFLTATKVLLRPYLALDERAAPLHARHGPVGLPRPLRCAPRSARSPIRVLLPLRWSDFLDSPYAPAPASSLSSSSRASDMARSSVATAARVSGVRKPSPSGKPPASRIARFRSRAHTCSMRRKPAELPGCSEAAISWMSPSESPKAWPSISDTSDGCSPSKSKPRSAPTMAPNSSPW